MALSAPTQLGTFASSTTATHTTSAVTAGTINAGTLVIVANETSAASAGGEATAVSDTAGNAYTKAIGSDRTATFQFVSVWARYYPSTLTAQTITATFPASNMSFTGAWAVTGAAASAAAQATGANNGLSANPTVTATGATTTPNALSFVAIEWNGSANPTTWPPTNYTALGTPQLNATRTRSTTYAYRILSATGTEAVSGAALPSSLQWAIALAIWPEAAAAGGAAPRRSLLGVGLMSGVRDWTRRRSGVLVPEYPRLGGTVMACR